MSPRSSGRGPLSERAEGATMRSGGDDAYVRFASDWAAFTPVGRSMRGTPIHAAEGVYFENRTLKIPAFRPAPYLLALSPPSVRTRGPRAAALLLRRRSSARHL